MSRSRANLLLLLAAMLWGAGDVAQKTVLDHINPLLAVGLRSLIGGILIAPLLILEARTARRASRLEWRRVGMVAVVFLLAVSLEQVAYGATSVTNGSFLINMSIILTPILVWVTSRTRPSRSLWAAAALALTGALLLGDGKAGLTWGNAVCLASASLYSVWFVLLGRLMETFDKPIAVAVIQFALTAVVGIGVGLAAWPVSWQSLVQAAPELMMLGALSTGLAFTLQVIAQRSTPASDCAVIVSAECVFATIAAMIVLGEGLNVVTGTGAALVIAAICLVQLPVASAVSG